jgi:hypothetical protein
MSSHRFALEITPSVSGEAPITPDSTNVRVRVIPRAERLSPGTLIEHAPAVGRVER